MRKLKILAILLTLFSHPGFAIDETSADIYVHGKVIASPCTLRQESQSVDLGQRLQVKDFKTAGSGSDWVPFTLNLDSCPPGTTLVTATFTGTPDEQTDLYKNSGTAQNVAIELQNTEGVRLGNGMTQDGTIDSSLHAYTYNLKARVYSQTGGVATGSVSAVVVVGLTYN